MVEELENEKQIYGKGVIILFIGMYDYIDADWNRISSSNKV